MNLEGSQTIEQSPLRVFGGLIALTKPTIVLSFALTGATAMVVEGSLLQQPLKFFFILLAVILTAASANAFNQYFEREIDAKMPRTAKKRPLPRGILSPPLALWFSVFLGLVAVFYLGLAVNWLSAFLALATILFYSFYYTLWLKPRTPYNIVIGGAAGATAPLIGWAAATGEISWLAWWMFLIIFLWTPPHFWALALCIKDQYAKVDIPMLPVVKGERRTQKEIWWYSVVLFPFTLIPLINHSLSPLYGLGALILGLYWLYLAWRLYRKATQKTGYRFFGYSIVYLMLLFTLMMV